MAPPLRPAMTMAEFANSITDIGDSVPSVNHLLYGPAGSGKTYLASGLPEALLLAFDPGWITAKASGKKCKISVINSYEKLMAAIYWLEDGNAERFQWIIADGLSILQVRLIQQFARDAWVADNTKRASPQQPDRADYFRQQAVLKNVVARLCDLPTNVCFTAHSEMGDDEAADTWVRPHIDGRDYKVGNFVTGLMTSIGYYAPAEVRKGKDKVQVRRMLWQQHRDDDRGITYLAKDQLNAYGRWMDDPTAEQIHAGVNQEEQPARGRRRTERIA